MEELIRYMVSKLVENPDSVEVIEKREDGRAHIQVYLEPEDMGHVIGRQGKIARAIRSIARAVGTKEQVMVTVDFDERVE